MPRHDLHLPPEMWAQILTKLPVKSILLCRCVCKTWYSLISSPNFISDHTTQTLNQSTGDRVLVHRRDTGNGVSSFSFHDNSFVESHDHHDVPELLRSPKVDIVGSCNGLICFSRRVIGTDSTSPSFHSFLIWNPSIRKLVELPYSCSHGGMRLLGFGFDSESRDYKVVRVAYHKTHGLSDVVVAESDISDLKNGVWRSSSFPIRSCYYARHSVYLYGNLHWVGSDDASTNFILVSFNLSSEVLQEMEMVHGAAEIIEDDDYIGSYTKIFLINGLLSVVVVKKMQRGDAYQDYCSVWSMKEYGVTQSWTKLFIIELPCKMDLSSFQRFWENGEVLLVERVVEYDDSRNVLVLYNGESRKSIVLLSANERILNACYYKESLILL